MLNKAQIKKKLKLIDVSKYIGVLFLAGGILIMCNYFLQLIQLDSGIALIGFCICCFIAILLFVSSIASAYKINKVLKISMQDIIKTDYSTLADSVILEAIIYLYLGLFRFTKLAYKKMEDS